MMNFGDRGACFWRGIRNGGSDSGHLGSIFLSGEVEDGDGDLLSTSEEQGGARNGRFR
jgi:hypothetical protein